MFQSPLPGGGIDLLRSPTKKSEFKPTLYQLKQGANLFESSEISLQQRRKDFLSSKFGALSSCFTNLEKF